MTHLQDIFSREVATDLQSIQLIPNREEVIAQIRSVRFSVPFLWRLVYN